MKKASNVFWGIIVIAVGVILALNAFEITDINIFFDGWWTLFIIIPCLRGLIFSHEKAGSLIGLLIGVFLLLGSQDVLGFDMLWKLALPAVIVIIGLRIIWGGIFGNKGFETSKRLRENGADFKNGTAVFAGSDLNFGGEIFEGADLSAIFGGVECDLRGAVINGDCVINASAVFGGIDILVPDNINVKVTSNSIFGGVSNKTHKNSAENQHTLFVNATCIFGGAEIK